VGEGHTDEPQTNQRLTVAQAAASLGITEGAVRSRIKRGTLATRREGGAVFVLLGGSTPQANQTPDAGVPSDQSPLELMREMMELTQERIRYLEHQVEEEREARRRADMLLARLVERIPELEAPTSGEAAREDAPESPESHVPSETPPDASGEAQEGSERPEERSWWRRLFEGG
jgi:hypothetical protein